MKIRQRITIVFTLLTGSIILGAFILVYLFSKSERSDIFYDRLTKRIAITEQFFLESDMMSPELKQKIKENFSHKLPNEIELVTKKSDMADSLALDKWLFLSTELLESIETNTNKSFLKDGYYCSIGFYNFHNDEYIVVVAAQDMEGEAYLKRLKFWMTVTCLFSFMLAFILSRMLAGQILKPIARKIEKANNIGVKNLSDRLQVINPKDEIGMLANAFNQLLDRLEQSFELQENFVRYASHELKNPLAVIIGESEILLSRKRTVSEYITTIEKINVEAEKLNYLVNQFLNLSKVNSTTITKNELQLDEIIFEILGYYNRQYHDTKITFNIIENSTNLENSDWKIIGNRDFLSTAFQNILDNAIKFSDNSPIIISLDRNGDQIIVSFMDEGVGVDPHEIDQLFEPLYRSAKTSQMTGTGLGLSIVKNIIELHNGTVTFDTSVSKGAKVDVVFN